MLKALVVMDKPKVSANIPLKDCFATTEKGKT